MLDKYMINIEGAWIPIEADKVEYRNGDVFFMVDGQIELIVRNYDMIAKSTAKAMERGLMN